MKRAKAEALALFLRKERRKKPMMDELTYETKYLELGTGQFPKPENEEKDAYENEE